jgi:anthranilate synthase component 2
MLTLIDNYDSFTYNLVHYLGELGARCRVYRNDQISVAKVLAEKPKAIVLSPGPATPNEAGICLELVEKAGAKIPILGVCLGHQTIGQVSTIHNRGVSLFENLPAHFLGTRYHSLIVERSSLPDCLEVTAETEDGIIMGLSHRSHRVHGVQFHPESIASGQGHALLANFLGIAGIARNKGPVEPVRVPA